MTEEHIELTIKTTAKGLQELMANMPGLTAALDHSINEEPATKNAALPESGAQNAARDGDNSTI